MRGRFALLVVGVSVLVSALGLASPAGAAVTTAGGTVNAGTFTVTGGALNAATPGTVTGSHDTIYTAAPRTLLDFSTFNLAAGNRLDIVVASRSDVVLIRVATGTTAQINGFLNVTTGVAASPGPYAIGEIPTNVGGNVWLVARTGVGFGGSARVNVGGLLAGTANLINDSDFTSGLSALSFALGTGSVAVDALGEIRVNSGLAAFIGDSVSVSGSVQDPAGVASRSDVLYAAAREYTLTTRTDPATGELDLGGWTVPPPSWSTSFTPVTLSGATTAGNVYVASVSAPTLSSSVLALGGTIDATGAVASGDGHLVVSAGSGFTVSGSGTPGILAATDGAKAQDFAFAPSPFTGQLTYANSLTLAATGTLTIDRALGGSGQHIRLKGGTVALNQPVTAAYGNVTIDGGAVDVGAAVGAPYGSVAVNGGTVDVQAPVGAASEVTVGATGAITVNSGVSAPGEITLAAGGDLTLAAGSSLTGPRYVLSTGANFSNAGALGSGRWIIYAPHPSKIVSGGPNSQQRARWGGTITSLPPGVVRTQYATNVNKYVFAHVPVITYTSNDVSKDYGVLQTVFPYTVDGSQLHPGVANLFLGDTLAQAVSGTPALSSAGAAANARVLKPSGYPILVESGSLQSPHGYGLVLSSTGRLTVVDLTNPEITYAITGTLVNGWYVSDVGIDWSLFDEASDIETQSGCDDFGVTADQAATTYTCRATSAGPTETVVSISVKRDTTAPVLTAAGTAGGAAYASGSWTNGDVNVSFACSDALAGAASTPASERAAVSTTYTRTCSDNAGHTSAPATFVVNIDRIAPAIAGVELVKAGGGSYAAGSWANESVTVSWQCTDAGGSGVVDADRSVSVTSTGTITPRCADTAGNAATGDTLSVRIDTEAPVLTIAAAGYTSGTWTNRDVTVTFACTDTGGSGVDSSSVRSADPAAASTSYSETCDDVAGNTSRVATFDVKIDRLPPTVTNVLATRAGGSAYAAGAWTNEDVTVTWECNDTGGSGLVATGGHASLAQTTTVSLTCADTAGNSVAQPFLVNIDKVAPALQNVPGDRRVFGTGPTPVTWTGPTASDTGGSGLVAPATCSPASGSIFQRGPTTVECSAADRAGNTVSRSFTVTVSILAATFEPPVQPVLRVQQLGRAIPVKVALALDDVPVVAPSELPVTIAAFGGSACTLAATTTSVPVRSPGNASSGDRLRWVDGAWHYVLDTQALATRRSACYRVSVLYGGNVAGSFFVQPAR